VFGCTVNEKGLVPLPPVGGIRTIQPTSLAAPHSHPGAVTVSESVVEPASYDLLTGEIEDGHVAMVGFLLLGVLEPPMSVRVRPNRPTAVKRMREVLKLMRHLPGF